jgi:hypothetical protein
MRSAGRNRAAEGFTLDSRETIPTQARATSGLPSSNLENEAMAKIQITNFERWGNLLKTWATGVNKLGDGNDYALPRTLQELKEQLARANVKANVPDELTALQFITPDKNTLVIVLPSREAIEEAEARLGSGIPYPLPPFYKEAFGGADLAGGLDWRKFNAQRLGEYTTNNCK